LENKLQKWKLDMHMNNKVSNLGKRFVISWLDKFEMQWLFNMLKFLFD